MKKISLWVLGFLVIGLLAACGEGGAESGGMAVTDAWARPAGAGDNSAAYFIIDNTQGEADVLQSAASPAAGAVEIHRSQQSSDGVMQMHPQHSVEVPASAKLVLEPGGLHVMLIGLTEELKVGDTIELTLIFEEAGVVELSVPVEE